MGMCGIIFDLDGVLCYTDHYHYLAWKALADRQSLPFDQQVLGAEAIGTYAYTPPRCQPDGEPGDYSEPWK